MNTEFPVAVLAALSGHFFAIFALGFTEPKVGPIAAGGFGTITAAAAAGFVALGVVDR